MLIYEIWGIDPNDGTEKLWHYCYKIDAAQVAADEALESGWTKVYITTACREDPF